MLAMPMVVLAGAWVSAVWAYRYLAVIVTTPVVTGPGLRRSGRLALAALAVAGFFTFPLGVKGNLYQKSNAKEVAQATAAVLDPGDLVISPRLHPDPIPGVLLRRACATPALTERSSGPTWPTGATAWNA
jgi:hypothetical protein